MKLPEKFYIYKIIGKVKKRFVSKNARSLLENFISLSSLQLIGMLMPLITLPYVLRVLGFSNYGTIILATSLVSYFQSLTDYSFQITATRDVAVFRSSQKKLSLIFSKVIIVKSIFLFISWFLISLIIFLYPPFYEERLVFFLTMLMLLGYVLFPTWFFQGIEQMRYITFLNIGVKLFFTICIFIFIKEENDYWVYPLLQSAGFLVAGFIGHIFLIWKFKLKFVWIKLRSLKNTISLNFPIFVNQFSPTLYNNTGTFILGLLTNTMNVGIYDAIKRIIDLMIAFIGIVSKVFFPFLNRRRDSFPMYRKLMLVTSVFLSVFAIICHKLIFMYLNVTYDNAFWVLSVLSIGVIGIAIYDIYGINYFIIRRRDKLVMRNTLYVSIIGLFFAIPLIYYFGIIGAALNLSISRLLLGIGLFKMYRTYNSYDL